LPRPCQERKKEFGKKKRKKKKEFGYGRKRLGRNSVEGKDTFRSQTAPACRELARHALPRRTTLTTDSSCPCPGSVPWSAAGWPAAGGMAYRVVRLALAKSWWLFAAL